MRIPSSLPSLVSILCLALTACGGKVVWDGPPSPFLEDGEDPCRWLNTGFLGSFDGAPFDATYRGGLSTYGPGGELFTMDGGGVIALYGSVDYRNDGDVPASLVWLRFPADGVSPAGWFCSASPSDMVQEGMGLASDRDSVRFSLTDLRRAPDCASGEPVEGALTADSVGGLAGDVAGHDVSAAFSSALEAPTPELIEFSGRTIVTLDPGDPATAYVIVPPNGFDPGALYCATVEASSPSTDGLDTLMLGDLRRLGGCEEQPAVEGSLAVCST